MFVDRFVMAVGTLIMGYGSYTLVKTFLNGDTVNHTNALVVILIGLVVVGLGGLTMKIEVVAKRLKAFDERLAAKDKKENS